MPIFFVRGTNQTKDTQQLSFTAGENLEYQQYVKRQATNSPIIVDAIVQSDAIGYVLNRRGATTGGLVTVQMISDLEFQQSSGPGGGVQSVTDDGSGVTVVDNTDPNNPIVSFGGVNVDGVTITGDGTVGNPLVGLASGSDTVITEISAGVFEASPNGGQPSVQWQEGGNSPIQNIAVVTPSGDNATAQIGRWDRPFTTIDAVFSDPLVNASTVVWVFAGTYLSDTYVLDGTKPTHYFVDHNVKWTGNGVSGQPLFQLANGSALNIMGRGQFTLDEGLFRNITPASVSEVSVEALRFQPNDGASVVLADTTSCRGFIKGRNVVQLSGVSDGWSQFSYGIDYWTNTDKDILSVGSFLNNGGGTIASTQGNPRIYVGGYTRDRSFIDLRSNIGFPYVVDNALSGDKVSKVIVNADGYLLGVGGVRSDQGMVDFYGNYNLDGSTFFNVSGGSGLSQISHDGIMVQNQDAEIGLITQMCRLNLNGKYYSNGNIPSFILTNVSDVAKRIYFNCKITSNVNQPCIQITENNAISSQIETVFKDATIITSGGTGVDSIVSLGDPCRIWVEGSLNTNTAISTDITNMTPAPVLTSTNYLADDEVP